MFCFNITSITPILAGDTPNILDEVSLEGCISLSKIGKGGVAAHFCFGSIVGYLYPVAEFITAVACCCHCYIVGVGNTCSIGTNDCYCTIVTGLHSNGAGIGDIVGNKDIE